MRISDWSSDVCSSDLQRRPAPGIGRSPRAAEPRHQDIEEGDEEGEAKHERPQRDPGIDVLEIWQVDRDAPVHALHAGNEHGEKGCVEGDEGHPGGELSHGLAVRSEEHTSELQSPMSNSHAVFSLKTKN